MMVTKAKIKNLRAKSKRKSNIWLLPVAAALLVVSVLYLKSSQNSPSVSENSPFTTEEANEIVNWKRYNSKSVTFKYPSDWILDEKNQVIFAPGNAGFRLVIHESAEKISDLKCLDFVSAKTVKGLRLQKYFDRFVEEVQDECWGFGMGDGVVIFISKNSDNSNIYRASYSYSKQQEEEAEKIFDQILSTFQFMN
jgi:hypothetical protein